ncbi:hypothetical protein [Caballeronia sp. S22]|uniref:hypothetical protein n=1 Tax=Caballeronia sp. S22 TaxID=3137182 RepID=UPI003530B7A5
MSTDEQTRALLLMVLEKKQEEIARGPVEDVFELLAELETEHIRDTEVRGT